MFIATLYERNQGKLSAMEVWVRKNVEDLQYEISCNSQNWWDDTCMDAKKRVLNVKIRKLKEN